MNADGRIITTSTAKETTCLYLRSSASANANASSANASRNATTKTTTMATMLTKEISLILT
ncbi:hypothetical protein TIFTF001_053918 [Ficus carica]|uniref:Uncharacterized protein n=1 Tax=Ficus carica TaxID=3494 RepID=A0AA88EGY8_FICCA|nr:hypothetical protein TIFTF001_053918 [Ficus carica]